MGGVIIRITCLNSEYLKNKKSVKNFFGGGGFGGGHDNQNKLSEFRIFKE